MVIKMTNTSRITNVSFSGFKSKSITERRRIRNAYQRQYRAKKKQEFLNSKKELQKVENDINVRANQLNKVQKGYGNRLKNEYNSIKNGRFNSKVIKNEKRKEYARKVHTLDAYSSLRDFAKQLLNNTTEYDVRAVKNAKTARAAKVAGIPTKRDKNGNLVGVLKNQPQNKINKYKNTRKSLSNGNRYQLNDLIDEYRKRRTHWNTYYSSDEIVSAAVDIINTPTFDNLDELDRNHLMDERLNDESTKINATHMLD